MGTPANIPFSNNGGNNQFSPGVGGGVKPTSPIVGVPGMGSGKLNTNPYSPIPVTTAPGATPTPGATASTSGTGTTVANPLPGGSSSNALGGQLSDIYGPGVGGALNELLSSMGGTDSAVLQEYIASLQPSFAQSKATLSAGLGAGGVGANSSVNALAQSNLQSQENADIAGESGQLTQSSEQLTAQVLESTEGASAAEQNQGWNVIGDVLNAGANVASAYI